MDVPRICAVTFFSFVVDSVHTFAPAKPFLCQSNFMEIIRLSQSCDESVTLSFKDTT